MSASQKRLLTAPTSKLTKINLVSMLRQGNAWILLPRELREQLYSMLPTPAEGEAPHDPDVHPLNTRYKIYIEGAIRRFGEDLAEGREQKKWRLEALEASRDRAEGKFDVWKEAMKEEYWGNAKEQRIETTNDEVQVNGHAPSGSAEGHENGIEIEDDDNA